MKYKDKLHNIPMRFFGFALLILLLSFGPLYLYFERVLKVQIKETNYRTCKESLEKSSLQTRSLILSHEEQAQRWFSTKTDNLDTINNQWIDVAVFEFIEDKWQLKQHHLNSSLTNLYSITQNEILKSYSKSEWPDPGIKKTLFNQTRLNYMEVLTINVPIQKDNNNEVTNYFIRINILPNELFSFMNSSQHCSKNILNSRGSLLFTQDGFRKRKRFLNKLQNYDPNNADITKTIQIQNKDHTETFLYSKIFKDFIMVSELKKIENANVITASTLLQLNGIMLFFFIILITLYWAKVYKQQLQYILNTIHNMSLGVFKSQSRHLTGEFGQIQDKLNSFSNNFINRRRMHSKLQKLTNLNDTSILRNFEDKQANIYDVSILQIELLNTDVILNDYKTSSSAKDFSNLWEKIHNIVSESQGIVDNISGGALRAIWLETPNSPNTINTATNIAIEVQQLVIQINSLRFVEDKGPYNVVSALHSGTVLLGLFGPKERKEFTPVGPVMKEAQEYCRVARITKSPLVCSRLIKDKINKRFAVSLLNQKVSDYRVFEVKKFDEIQLKGKGKGKPKQQTNEILYEKKLKKKVVLASKKPKKKSKK